MTDYFIFKDGCGIHVLRCLKGQLVWKNRVAGKMAVVKFGGLPSKCISLILTGYNLTDWSSTIIFVQS